MIKKSEVFPVGQITKTHGLKGELAFNTDNSILEEVEIPYIVLEPDGILVPFYIENVRFKSDSSGFIQLEGIATEEQARELVGQNIYLPNKYLSELDENDVHVEYFIGFQVFDETLGKIGTISEIDDNTENILFVVTSENNDFLIPAAEEYITEIDEENKILRMDLPEGLLDL
ncbi:Ribosome maturation factor RimM [uncultured Paludibacter sp.]|uniref:Ribosome maturation factor RimM n=1 Tax=uncultured Paludibacter sp. TaxID=497635 RepID=A0A653AK84_9BACT|nr:Ribosome maturation factor RimM [uncultured Paludibacter sp.]